MYKTLVFHLGRLFCFSMAAPSPFVYINSFINTGQTYANQRARSNSIPQMAYIPFALKLATLSYACSSWTKASLILQQQFQIVTNKSILTESEKKLISGLHITVAYLLLRIFHQKNGTVINLKQGGRFEKLNLFSSKLIIPLIIGIIICAIIEESGLLLLLQITSGSRRVYSISGKNAIKVEGFRNDTIESKDKKNKNSFSDDIETKTEEEKMKNEKLLNNELKKSNDSLSYSSNNEQEIEKKDNHNNNIDNDKIEENNENSISVEEKEMENITKNKTEKFYHDDCCVCLGSCEYPQMESFCTSETHVAHTQCMLKWLQASKKRQCPLCRQPLQVYIISESMHDYMYGYPPLYKIIQRNIDWKCFLKRTGITFSVTTSLLLILKLRMMTNQCKYNNLRYSSSS
jgi:hypothetical protein